MRPEFIEELNEMLNNTSFNGSYEKVIDIINDNLSQYSDKRIEYIKDTLMYVYPNKTIEIDGYSTLEIIYEYSKLI